MRRAAKQPSIPTIFLVPEDEIGYFVFEAIRQKKKINARIDWRGPSRTGKNKNIADLAFELEELLETILREKEINDCILVVHDTNASNPDNRRNYEEIARICKTEKYKAHVTLLRADEEIEAWLLADVGVCKWLGQKPKSWDGKKKPSSQIETWVNKKFRRHWNRETKRQAAEKMTVTGMKYSRSMQEAMDTFLALPCTKVMTT
ncbi:MAG: hypothetical protein ACYDBJ_00800 [Aggregatilineales bacterium]